MEKYTVGQIAKSLGVSPQTLRHYESLGLIQSSRNDNNQYRTYSMDATKILFMISIYRSMGFSLPEIKGMLQEMKSDEVLEMFQRRIQQVDQEIQQLTMMKHELTEYSKSIERAHQQEGTCWIENDSMEVVSIMKGGSGFSLIEEDDRDLLAYQKLAPHVRQGFVISRHILDQDGSFDFQYGVMLNKEVAKKHLSESDYQQYQVCLTGPIAKTVIKIQSEPFSKALFEPFFKWIEQQGYQVTSDLYGVARYHAYFEQEVTLFEFIVSVS